MNIVARDDGRSGLEIRDEDDSAYARITRFCLWVAAILLAAVAFYWVVA